MSNKKISIWDMEKSNLEFKKSHYVSVSGFKPQTEKTPIWFKNFYENDYKQFQKTIVDLIINIKKELLEAINNLDVKLNARIDKLEARIDNLVKVNNLKE